MHKIIKIAVIIVALAVISAFTLHAVLNSMVTLAPGVIADLWLYTPKPETIPLDGSTQIVNINGFATYSVTELVTIKLQLTGKDGSYRDITFTTHQGAFTKQVIIPIDFHPGWFGTYPIQAELLAENGTVIKSSNIVTLTYT